MEMLTFRIFVPLDREGLNFVANFDVVAGDDLVEKGERFILTHVGNTQQSLALRNMTFVVRRSFLVGRIELADGPVVLSPFFKDENLSGIMPACARLSSKSNSRRPRSDDYQIFHTLGFHASNLWNANAD